MTIAYDPDKIYLADAVIGEIRRVLGPIHYKEIREVLKHCKLISGQAACRITDGAAVWREDVFLLWCDLLHGQRVIHLCPDRDEARRAAGHMTARACFPVVHKVSPPPRKDYEVTA